MALYNFNRLEEATVFAFNVARIEGLSVSLRRAKTLVFLPNRLAPVRESRWQVGLDHPALLDQIYTTPAGLVTMTTETRQIRTRSGKRWVPVRETLIHWDGTVEDLSQHDEW